MSAKRNHYFITMTTNGRPETLDFFAETSAAAVAKARVHYNATEGRTRNCYLAPRSFRAASARKQGCTCCTCTGRSL